MSFLSLLKISRKAGGLAIKMCLPGIFAILGGVMVLAAVYLEWDWFINFYRVKPVFEELGNKKAKMFYTFLALLMIAMGVWMVIS